MNNANSSQESIIPQKNGKASDRDFQLTADLQYPTGNGKKMSSSSSLDPWDVADTQKFGTPWNELSQKEKTMRILMGIAKAIALLALLYFFVCSLDLLSLGFRIVGGRTTGKIFQQSDLIQNPVVGVMVGILTTVLVQSSSTSTSIIVSMVSADFLSVHIAIPIIMGANIGTSITNTIVSLTQAGDRNQFRRAFAGATVHDMFNWLTVISLLIVEVTTGYLEKTTTAIMDKLVDGSSGGGEVQVLSVITKPLVDKIVQIDKEVLECWSKGDNCTNGDSLKLIKEFCSDKKKKSAGKAAFTGGILYDSFQEITTGAFEFTTEDYGTTTSSNKKPCKFLFHDTGMSEPLAGAIILICALIILCLCLILIVKVLNSVLQGQIAVVIKKTLNSKIPYVPWLTGYITIIVGAVMTFLVQSSSVFTSALTPLVGLGVLTVERTYPLTLGSNIGTTTTALMASLAVEGDKFYASMQIALCHLLFNITGILLFYPIPFMRFPIPMAKFLGDTTAKYRWFAIVYMVLMFVVVPAVFFGLSFAGTAFVITAASIVLVLFFFIVIVNLIRKKKPEILPETLKTWKWLPIWFRSLEPYDQVFNRFTCCRKLKEKNQDYSRNGIVNQETEFNNEKLEGVVVSKNGNDNPGYMNQEQ